MIFSLFVLNSKERLGFYKAYLALRDQDLVFIGSFLEKVSFSK